MSLERVEHLMDDARESSMPDSLINVRICQDDDCGACVPEDECEKIGGRWYCENCIARSPHFYASLRHYEAVIAMSDGGSDR
jgi:hypothetical protein